MQPNQQSLNIFVVFHPVAHCARYRGTMGQSSWNENFVILKVVKEIETTN